MISSTTNEKIVTDFQKKVNSINNQKQLISQNLTNLDTLSMGMTNDYMAAIQEGATIIRIGTALFGAR